MKKLLISLIVLGLGFQGFTQVLEEKLKEVEILGANYKYISQIDQNEVSELIKELHKTVARFDDFNEDTYNEGDDKHYVSFKIPKGKILASYDEDGELLKTVERFENARLPKVVIASIIEKYPGWTITKDVYYITYHHMDGITKKYKVLIKNEGERKRVKIDSDGYFL